MAFETRVGVILLCIAAIIIGAIKLYDLCNYI